MMCLKADYSQQEPRLLVHFAALMKLPGAAEAVAAFHTNPLTDYHRLTMEIVNKVTNRSYVRDALKAINLGIMYGMGLEKLCRQLGLSEEEGLVALADYHEALPFVKKLADKVSGAADRRGYILTISSRRRRFELYEPAWRDKNMNVKPLPYEMALERWPDKKLKRFGVHKALNSLLQGSAADQTKYAMLALAKLGLTPQLSVHDELVASVGDHEEARKYKHTMEQCYHLAIPVVSESKVGPSWGDANELITLPHGYVM